MAPGALMVARILCLVVAVLVASCAAVRQPEPPEVSIAGLGFGRPGLFEQELRVDLRLWNPNEYAIGVDALSFGLEVNDLHFADGRTLRDFEMPALGETVVPVMVTVSTTDLLERVMQLGVEQRLDYRLTGTAELGELFGTSVPFEQSGKLAIPKLPMPLPATSSS
jgi:LEA14-like dessication related protein